MADKLSRKELREIVKEVIDELDAGGKISKDLGDEASRVNDVLRESLEIQREINKDSSEYVEQKKNLKRLQKEVDKIEKQSVGVKARILTLQKQIDGATEEEKKELEKILIYETELDKLLTARLAKQKKSIEATEIALRQANKYKGFLAQSNADLKKAKGYWGNISKFVGGFADVFKWEKSIKMTAMNMGLMTTQSKALSKNIQVAAYETANFGVDIEQIAKIQGTYSDEIGRAVMLTAKGAKGLGAMSVATGLGAEGAGKLAGELDTVGFNAERTTKFVEQTMQDATKMGLNSTKVVKNLAQNIKLLNKYNFKGGTKGLAKMAQMVTQMGVGMDMVAPMADKLFDIEGAVEMSAQLQVMGGEWSKLADPFKLMYMARNDMKGLTEAVIGATKGAATFNKETKEFDIAALDMDKLRKIAEMTGVKFEDLVQSAKNAAKFSKIDMQIGAQFKDDATKKFIENTATFDENGVASIMIGTDQKVVSQLTALDKQAITKIIEEKKTMEERAKAARSLDEMWGNTVIMLKQLLVPIVESINEKMMPAMDGWKDKIKEFIPAIIEFAKTIGKFIGTIGKFIIEFPGLSAGLFLLFEAGKWMLAGAQLRAGFNMAGGGMGPMGPAAPGSGMFGTTAGAGMGANFKAAGSSSMLKLGGAIVGLTTAYTTYNKNKEKGMASGENLGRSSLKGAGAGLGAWGGAAAGAAIGSVVPVVGTLIGGLIGGALGAWGGGALGDAGGDALYGKQKTDDGVVFNAKDRFTKVNDGMMVAGTNVNGNKELARTLSSMAPGFGGRNALMNKSGTSNASAGAGAPGAMNIKHEDMNIKHTITVNADPNMSAELRDAFLKDPIFQKYIAKTVHTQTNKELNGGKN